MTLPKNVKALINEETNDMNSTLGIADPKTGIVNAAQGLKKRVTGLKAEGQSTTHAEAELDKLRHLYRGGRLVTETGEVKR